MDKLKMCPCGRKPEGLLLQADGDPVPQWAYAYPDCCDWWHVAFRNQYARLNSFESMERATRAWNAAPRSEQLDALDGKHQVTASEQLVGNR